ncbi:hypothetical protein CRG98_043846 [Punica granatum]|uniref:Uncharacterized protein n=1 Tax=Punica granatum TaxID=22663 RepID=A0A2I0HVH2_PUNGR|nr:hypothetical protein CRG98_043846 [Punica granatum]
MAGCPLIWRKLPGGLTVTFARNSNGKSFFRQRKVEVRAVFQNQIDCESPIIDILHQDPVEQKTWEPHTRLGISVQLNHGMLDQSQALTVACPLKPDYKGGPGKWPELAEART